MPQRSLLVAALALSATLSACAGPETRVRRALVDAGIRDDVAACMAERMADRLSLGQLQRLGRIGKADEAESLKDFRKRVSALEDPEIVTVVGSSAAICWLG
jgi:hypothetical protein